MKKNGIIISILSLVVFLFFIAGVDSKEQDALDLYLQQKVHNLNTEYLVALNGYQMLTDFLFDESIKTPEVLQLMAEANRVPAQNDQTRTQLLQHLTPLYLRITALNFRQLHFHLPDSRSFLRFHRPEKYGDSLVGIRDTVVEANTTRQKITAFEEGRILNGFRFVYPLLRGEEHLGSVEISISFSALERSLNRLFAKNYLLLIDRRIVEEKVFREEQPNYEFGPMPDRYIYDREVLQKLMAADSGFDMTVAGKLFASVEKDRKNELDHWRPFAYPASYAGKSFTVAFLPIKNHKQINIAYLVSFEEDDYPVEHKRHYIFTLVLLSLIFAGGLSFTLYLFLTRERLEKLSATDFLTGIWNRSKGSSVVRLEHERAIRYATPYSIVMLDIDHFKKINDTYGHEAGDMVLKNLADLVGRSIREIDFFCRWGGEEFVIMLPETPLPLSLLFAEKIRGLVEQTSFPHMDRVTISLGVSQFTSDDSQFDNVIKRADLALYEAKSNGRNQVYPLPPQHA